MKKKISLLKIKNLAKKKLDKKKWNWLDEGTGEEITLKKNIEDLKNFKVLPRLGLNVSKISIKTKFLDEIINSPLIVSPVGHLTQFHKHGEAELAKGCQTSGTFFTLSHMSRLNISDVRKFAPKVNLIFQLYCFGNLQWIKKEIDKAIKFKVKAICITIDVPTKSHKYRGSNDNYDARKFGRRTNYLKFYPEYGEKNNWKNLKKIINYSSIPVIIKGILNPADAKNAFKIGAKGVWVSNHGGRALDSGISSLESLIKIRKIFKKKLLIVDGGVRTGVCILKYLKAGANIVSVGRPAIWGLIYNGHKGVEQSLKLFNKEFESNLKLSGIEKF